MKGTCLYSLAHVVCLAYAQLREAVGLVTLLVGTRGHNGLAAALCARGVRAGAEEQLVREVWRHAVEELAQSFAAACAVTGPGARRRSDARRHVLGAQLLARVVHVTRFSRVQTPVHCRETRL